jgi:hypothetical protein
VAAWLLPGTASHWLQPPLHSELGAAPDVDGAGVRDVDDAEVDEAGVEDAADVTGMDVVDIAEVDGAAVEDVVVGAGVGTGAEPPSQRSRMRRISGYLAPSAS